MVHYLFTNDLRREAWPDVLMASARLIRDDAVPSASADKSLNNYVNTQLSYMCFRKGSRANDFCCRGEVQPVILNFINRFQFPNARTKASYMQSIDDAMSIAPLRLAIQVMYALGLSGSDQAHITYDELYNDIILNEEAAQNSVSVFNLAARIVADRESGIVLDAVPKSSEDIQTEECEWIHGGRQIHELFDLLKFVPFIAEDTVNGGFRLSIPAIADSLLAKQFFNIVNNHNFWSAPDGADWDAIRESYMQYMDEGLEMFSEQSENGAIADTDSLQRIIYGAPGTGKSFGTKLETKGKLTFRTTFHPDSDYSTFVGAYKPTMEEPNCDTIVQVNKIVKDQDGNESVQPELKAIRKSEISYDFVPQAFVRAYVAAWQNMSDPDDNLKVKPVYLVIEEINRGNCAQIFGDLFQLLDRNDAGFSDYPIDADHDLERFLAKNDQLGALCAANLVKCGTDPDLAPQIIQGKKLSLPPNLFIRATMNTSDQSLFPIDSAFKRRWDWEYAPIKDEEKGWYVKVGETKYKWWSFLEKINDIVFNETQSADKQMGYFFVKLPEGQTEIDLKKFVNKVAFYLWNDVFKDCEIREDALKLKDANGQHGEPIKFTDFFKPHSAEVNVKVVKDLFEGLGVEEIKPEGGTDDSATATSET